MLMKSFYIGVFLSLWVITAHAQTDTTTYLTIAKEVQKRLAPDKRAVYFNLQFKGDSVKLESTSADVIKTFVSETAILNQEKLITELLPAKSLNDLVYAVVNVSVGNNRANPQHGAELMTQTLLGTPVQVLKKQGAFYLVKTPDNYLAWTDGSLKLMNEQAFKEWQKADKIVFTADYGHAFTSPRFNGMRVSDLVNGNILQLLAWGKVFCKISYPDGRIGYVETAKIGLYKDWVKRSNPTAKAILKTAETLIGVPYLWGGTSVKGVDCSGFTKTAYFLNGVVIPRDASQQALVGKEIDVLEGDSISLTKCLKNLLPGDLLFFSAAKRRGINGGRVSHTAIYIGNGEFIQSASMVKISSFLPTATNYDGGQSPTLVGARRILTEIGKPEITRIDQHNWYKGN